MVAGAAGGDLNLTPVEPWHRREGEVVREAAVVVVELVAEDGDGDNYKGVIRS